MKYDVEFFEKKRTLKGLRLPLGSSLDLTQFVPATSDDKSTHYDEYLLSELLEENNYKLFSLEFCCLYEPLCSINLDKVQNSEGIEGRCTDSDGNIYGFVALARRRLEKEDITWLVESKLDFGTYDLDNASVVFTYVNGEIRPPKCNLLQSRGEWRICHGEYFNYYYDKENKIWVNLEERCPPLCDKCHVRDYVDSEWAYLCAVYGWDENEGAIRDVYE